MSAAPESLVRPQHAGADPTEQVTVPGLLTLRSGGRSARLHLRTLVVVLILTAAAAGVGWWNLISGSASLGAAEALAAFTGQADDGTARVILEWRAPRVVFTLIGGAALAVAGAVFQSQTRNPLGSPDIIGFSTGAYTGVLAAASIGIAGIWTAPLAAIIGGLATGSAVYLLAVRRSAGGMGAAGMRLILVGIGISIFLGALNTYLVTVLDLETAMSVASWGSGSVNTVGWAHAAPLVALCAVTFPVMLAHARDMTLIEMGDDTASALGIGAERVRLVQFVCGVLLVAAVTAGAGPIAFIALVAPQVALRLTGAGSVQLLPAAAMGALLLTAADAVARTEPMPANLPVGVVTLILGGVYLVWLLISMSRRRMA
ncbi:iron chelate uptake ABC transporter family permease subunit [Nesterenkonia sp. NBAIMH1]|uniref:FecCD family ABC transporter permease n=1 Tax=Nesterenkonia sp. NBAIMH1 TaxID=2600320 RepID=UPI0011B76F41|nr:iron chelate uptake ABC transporter family permease subunit [Nesterenkonia sp. NBAIMH1]